MACFLAAFPPPIFWLRTVPLLLTSRVESYRGSSFYGRLMPVSSPNWRRGGAMVSTVASQQLNFFPGQLGSFCISVSAFFLITEHWYARLISSQTQTRTRSPSSSGWLLVAAQKKMGQQNPPKVHFNRQKPWMTVTVGSKRGTNKSLL